MGLRRGAPRPGPARLRRRPDAARGAVGHLRRDLVPVRARGAGPAPGARRASSPGVGGVVVVHRRRRRRTRRRGAGASGRSRSPRCCWPRSATCSSRSPRPGCRSSRWRACVAQQLIADLGRDGLRHHGRVRPPVARPGPGARAGRLDVPGARGGGPAGRHARGGSAGGGDRPARDRVPGAARRRAGRGDPVVVAGPVAARAPDDGRPGAAEVVVDVERDQPVGA